MDLFEQFRSDSNISPNIFSLKKFDWEKKCPKFSKVKSKQIVKAVSCNSYIILATANCSIIRIKCFEDSLDADEIELSNKTDDIITNMFLDNNGYHLIIAMKSGDNYYINSKANKPKKLSKISGVIESLAFDNFNTTEMNTKSFLIGTSLGIIYEMSLDNNGKEKVFQQLYQFDRQTISSIYFEQLSKTDKSIDVNNDKMPYQDLRFLIIFTVSSPTKLYNFIGEGNFSQIFSESFVQSSSYVDLPGEISSPNLFCISKSNSLQNRYFTLMTEAGLYNGVVKNVFDKNGCSFNEAQLIPYLIDSQEKIPQSFVPSDFHFLLLYNNCLQILSSINGQLIEQIDFQSENEKPIGLFRDPLKQTLFIYTLKSIYHISITDEDKHIWAIYLNKALASDDDELFSNSLKYCKSKEQQELIFRSKAEFSLQTGRINESTKYFARSGLPFEEIVLSLLRIPNLPNNPTSKISFFELFSFEFLGEKLNYFLTYLVEVLSILPQARKSQRTMLSTWICELYLHQLTLLDIQNIKIDNPLTLDFQNFLRANRSFLDYSTIFHLISYRNNNQLLIFFAKIMGDYHRVISMLLNERKYNEAIEVISGAPFEKISLFIYKISPILIRNSPERFFQMAVNRPQISIQGLLPSLVHYASSIIDSREENHVILYLQEVVDRYGFSFNQDSYLDINIDIWLNSIIDSVTIHIFIWFLAKYDNSEIKLSYFLQQLYRLQLNNALHEIVEIDKSFILRQCRIYDKKRSAIFSLLLLQNDIQAVKEALIIDLNLAKEIATSQQNPELRHHLWMEVAKYTSNSDNNLKNVISLISESQNSIDIEDILPVIPDFTEIELFKEEVCQSLDICSERINSVKLDIQLLSDSVENTVTELEGMKHRAYSTVLQHQNCEFCSDSLFGNQFYLFPCSHGFHFKCLFTNSEKILSKSQFVHVQKLDDSIKSITARTKEFDVKLRTQLDSIQQELDGYIAAECPLCGYFMINSLSLSLIPTTSLTEAKTWEL